MKKIIFLFVLIIAGAISLFAQRGMNNGLSGKGSTDESIDALRSGFTRPGSDYRALPLGFKQKNETMSGYAFR